MCSMPRTTKTTKQTAAACYAERHTECQDLLRRIASLGDRSAVDQKGLEY